MDPIKKGTYRLVCSDIDGTLLDSERDLSTATAGAIRALDHLGPDAARHAPFPGQGGHQPPDRLL